MRNEDKKTCTCDVCGKIFPYRHGYGVATCSKFCLSELRKSILSKDTMVKKVCKNCGKEYIQEHWRKSDFCCKDCYWEYRRSHSEDEYADVQKERSENAHEIRKCEWCGKDFYVYKKSKKRFCSNDCRKAYSRTDEQKEKRKRTMLERYGSLSLGGLGSGTENEEAKRLRLEKQADLCEKSNMTLLGHESRFVLKVKCNKCGAEFNTVNLSYMPYDRIYCKHCDDRYKHYVPAMKIYDFLDSNNIVYIKNDRSIISPHELDIYIPSKQLAIEVDGNYWHSELCGKDKKYHIGKTDKCAELGIKLVHIFEDEIDFKWDIVQSRLKSMLGIIDSRIYARKCTVKEIGKEDKKRFNNTNHIQGDTNSSVNLGLFHDDKLLSVMTFGKERNIYKAKKEDGNYELIRFSSLLNYEVVGSFSKLLAFFVKKYKPKRIKTYADIRWSGEKYEETVYFKNGFKYVSKTVPNYWYFHKNNPLKRLHRFNFTKMSILKKNPQMNKDKTEWTLMQELGYNRIWDCGNLKFELLL